MKLCVQGTSLSEPVWPSDGKTVGWQAERPGFDSASAVISLQKLLVVGTAFVSLLLSLDEILKRLSLLSVGGGGGGGAGIAQWLEHRTRD